MRRVSYHNAHTNHTVKRCAACWKSGLHDEMDVRKGCIFSVCHGATHSAYCPKCHRHNKLKKRPKSITQAWYELRQELKYVD